MDDSPVTSAPPPAPQSPPAGLAKVGNSLNRAAAQAADYVRTVVRYYWSNRVLFKEFILEHVLNLRPSASRQREIRLNVEDVVEGAEFGDDGWKVRLPDCCVVCGQRTGRDWEIEVSELDNVAWAVWTPLLGAVIGVLLSVFLWTRWLLPVGIVAGFLLGYRYRSRTRVELRFRKCEKDAGNKKLPRVRLFPDQLIIRVGQVSVRQQFLGIEGVAFASDSSPSDPAATSLGGSGGGPVDAAVEEPPLTMALADEVHGTVRVDDRPHLSPDSEPGGDAWFSAPGSQTTSDTPSTSPPALTPYSQSAVFPAPPRKKDDGPVGRGPPEGTPPDRGAAGNTP